jgi:hypothetical protein
MFHPFFLYRIYVIVSRRSPAPRTCGVLFGGVPLCGTLAIPFS